MNYKSVFILFLCFFSIALFGSAPNSGREEVDSAPTEFGRFKSIFSRTNAIKSFGFVAGAGSSYAAVRDQALGIPLHRNIWAMCSGLSVFGALANYCWSQTPAVLQAQRDLKAAQAKVAQLADISAEGKRQAAEQEEDDRDASRQYRMRRVFEAKKKGELVITEDQMKVIQEMQKDNNFTVLETYLFSDIINSQKKIAEAAVAEIEQKSSPQKNVSLFFNSFIAGTCIGGFGAKVRLTEDDRVRSFGPSIAK